MEQVTNIALNALKNYFNSLSKLGYKNDKEVGKLLVLLYIEEIVTSGLNTLTEEEFNVIMNTLNCLASSTCLIEFPSYFVYDDITHDTLNNFSFRITEDSNIRVCEQEVIRTKI